MYVLSSFSVSPEIIITVCWTWSNQLINQSIVSDRWPRTQILTASSSCWTTAVLWRVTSRSCSKPSTWVLEHAMMARPCDVDWDFYHSWCRLDMTFAVDWALNNNDLSIYLPLMVFLDCFAPFLALAPLWHHHCLLDILSYHCWDYFCTVCSIRALASPLFAWLWLVPWCHPCF